MTTVGSLVQCSMGTKFPCANIELICPLVDDPRCSYGGKDSEGKMNAVRQWMEMTQSNVLHPNADVSSLETTLAKLADIENIITTELKSQLEVMQTVGHSLKDLGSVNHLDHTDIVNQQVNHVRDELLRLKEQLVQMESFHRFLDKENSWIVNLKEFTTRATDHIGGSYRIVGQHVQLLKELLEGHPCRCFDDVEKHAKDLVKSLDNDHYLSTVNHKLNSLRSHWQFVYTESQTATSNLSEVLKQTQLIETELNKIFKWCDQMETTYKTPITSSVERMEETNAEFLKYEGLVTTSQEMILKVLKRSPQQKKNNCYLSNQLDQLKQRWQKITAGHQDYHKASDFFLKISTLDSFLKSTKSTLDSIKLTSADTDCITSYLERCRVLKSGLADIETDIQQTLLIGSPSKIAAKEKLNVADVEVQVNKLKSYWQSLNSKIDNKIKFFETAFTIADLCSKESDELHSWLSETDKQLNERKDYAQRLDQSEEDLEWSKAIQHQIIKWQIRFNEFDQKSSVLANMAEAESLDSLRTHIQTFKKQISDINDKCVGMRVYLQEYVQFMKESKKERKNLSDEIEKLLSQLTYDIAENKLLDILDEYQNLQRVVDDLGEKTLLFVQRKGVNKVLEEDMAITDLLWQSLTDKLFLVEKKKQLSSNIDQIEDDITTVNALLSFKTLNRQYLQDISKVDYNVKNTKQLLESVPTKFADLKASIDEADKKSRDDAVKEEMARLNMLQDKWDTLDVQNRFAKFAKIIELYRKVRGDLSFFTDWLSKAEVAISIARTVNDSTRAKEIEKQIPEYKIKFATLCQEIAEIYESAAASMYSGEITSIIKQFKSVLRYFRPEEFDEAVETSISDLQMIMEVSLADQNISMISIIHYNASRRQSVKYLCVHSASRGLHIETINGTDDWRVESSKSKG
ncbi:uncharacterized protein TRIADDRAFT_60012 [Trichoplax adhaerens]|uniref:Uncharacterized protein n=1 Tax=Trichoplax adhaerens TaxID=10228 RepID=B3S725_TRIAD|nr:predicted protein [Trichoplax adhaerens]EDV21494.1 predicted protein [Trichoplax adhaerens]|eukprot:XP_002116094.1 predicted protein [Trichoplax adhaerens]